MPLAADGDGERLPLDDRNLDVRDLLMHIDRIEP
jgi:hypothetical protein